MADYSIKILNLYPDLLNLCGDTGNVLVLKNRCAKRGIEAKAIDILSCNTADFSDADILLIGGGGEREQLLALNKAKAFASGIKNFAENGGVILATCSGYQMLSNTFALEGKTYDGLKVLDIDISECSEGFMGDFAIETDIDGTKATLAGFQNHKNKTDIKDLSPLGKVVFGTGDNGEFEGVRYKNIIATFMYGPILPKNPELADFLIKAALKNKYRDFTGELSPLDDSAETKAKQFILNRNKR